MTKSILVALLLVPVCLAAADWQELEIRLEESAWASSTLCEQIGGRQVCYPPDQLFDGDAGSCWVEGAPGDGIGEWVLFVVNRPVQALSLVNGFARSPALYENNGRIKSLRLSFAVGFTAPGLVTELDYYLYFLADMKQVEFGLADSPQPQEITFSLSAEEHERLVLEALERFYDAYPSFMREIEKDLDLGPNIPKEELGQHPEIFELFGMSCLRLEILQVYPGKKYQDTCLSEVSVRFE
jgi:hypothetical protein